MMTIDLQEIPVRDLVKGYRDSAEAGVVGYDGKLNIRPAYQREFVYKDKERNAVIDTILKGYPLNVMYWCVNDDGTFELLDGQQRTVSICQYVQGDFSVKVDGEPHKFDNLTDEEKDTILNYPLQVYFCSNGTAREKLAWFETINIGTVELTKQELRNAIYSGPWTTECKKYFSKTQCPAHQIAGAYLSGSAIRQDYLQTVLSWIADKEDCAIEDYMSNHQHDTNCNELWLYFQAVINWVKATFPHYRREMKGVDWGLLYNRYKDVAYDPAELEKKVAALIMDDDVTKKNGAFAYVLGDPEKVLNIRAFTPAMASAAYERQKGVCPKCGKHFKIEQMQADHIKPWSKGGKTNADNCQMLCAPCNQAKSNK